jgi:hypothetical protein
MVGVFKEPVELAISRQSNVEEDIFRNYYLGMSYGI